MKKGSLATSVMVILMAGCNSGTGPSPNPGIHGWAVGAVLDGYGTILHTASGVNWSRQGSQETVPAAGLISVSAVDSMTAWAAGGTYEGFGVVMKTTDGGNSWLRMGDETSIPNETSRVVGVSATTAWLSGSGNSILKTTDGGVSWQDMSDPAHSGNVWRGMSLVDQSNIWLCGGTVYDGRVIHSTDGGVSWRSESDSLFETWPLITIAAWDAGNAWVVGHGYTIARTTDGGDNWEVVTPDSMHMQGNDANGICLLSPEEAWVVTDAGGIWRTTDGGDSWIVQDVPDEAKGFYLVRISALDPSTAWVNGVGAYSPPEGITLHTTDGGATWNREDDGSLNNMWGISFVDDLPN
ncbi:MAG: hypothetical protein KAH54_08590 [Candidatus Sabulitectum sp.]|nr:hypothetical protein [Candidatus Sabulitectum sp.]